ncbi:hypothetical protein ACFLYU_03555 [Candidatus Dependentiae bacterium]
MKNRKLLCLLLSGALALQSSAVFATKPETPKAAPKKVVVSKNNNKDALHFLPSWLKPNICTKLKSWFNSAKSKTQELYNKHPKKTIAGASLGILAILSGAATTVYKIITKKSQPQPQKKTSLLVKRLLFGGALTLTCLAMYIIRALRTENKKPGEDDSEPKKPGEKVKVTTKKPVEKKKKEEKEGLFTGFMKSMKNKVKKAKKAFFSYIPFIKTSKKEELDWSTKDEENEIENDEENDEEIEEEIEEEFEEEDEEEFEEESKIDKKEESEKDKKEESKIENKTDEKLKKINKKFDNIKKKKEINQQPIPKINKQKPKHSDKFKQLKEKRKKEMPELKKLYEKVIKK